MSDRNVSNTWAAWIGGAIGSTIEWYRNMGAVLSFDFLSGEWGRWFYDTSITIAKSLPAIIIGGMVGVFVKKAGEDIYNYFKNKITKK